MPEERNQHIEEGEQKKQITYESSDDNFSS